MTGLGGRPPRTVPLAAGVGLAALAALAHPQPARAQTMLDQEQRLIDLHSLLLSLPPLQSPGALGGFQVSAGLEAITIPTIDGQTGSKVQITASDRTPVFPRPRVQVGLPVPVPGLRAFAGAAYIPPIRVNQVSTSYGALEAGLAFTPGPFRAGARVHGVLASSRSPVTDRTTRDRLETTAWGADASLGVSLPVPWLLEVTPYAGAGVVGLKGRFHVTSDGNTLASDYTGAALHLGARVLLRDRWEGVAEWEAYPGRLEHAVFRVGYVFF